jgi:transitional endoplasmic reticulum ATPase
MAKELKLKVAEAIQDDVNKGIVRVDSAFLKSSEIRPGDIVEIEGERKTIAIVDRSYPGDIGLNIIRMDGIIRRNAKTGIGELVKISKADVKEAKKITIAPARKGIMVRAPPDLFRRGLLGRAVVKGDIISLGGTKRRRTAMTESPFFSDIFSMLDESMMGFGFSDIKFVVVETSPKEAVLITDQTEIVLNPEAVELKEEEKLPEVAYEDIGGLSEELKKIREMVELPLKHPEIFERLGIEPPKGVLLHGPPGTGKTLLAKAVANETNANFILINGPEIMSKYYGQSEENLRKKFEDAEKSAPSIIFIDEIDAIASKREETHGEVEKRVVAQLLALMDGLQSRGKVVVIAASNIPNSLDPALRRPGRFDREIEINVPNKEGRLDILKIHTRNMPIEPPYDISQAKLELNQKISKLKLDMDTLTLKKQDEGTQDVLKNKKSETELLKKILDKLSKPKNGEPLSKIMSFAELNVLNHDENDILCKLLLEALLADIANITHGFVGADMAALAKEAAMIVIRRVLPDVNLKEEKSSIPKEVLEKLVITQKDFMNALKVVRPSALREVLMEIPTVKWDEIGGMDDVKQELKEAVEWPLKNPEAFARLGVRPPRGILIYGAPGTGKTMLAKAVATESEANFISVNGPELLSKWVGESEKAVRKIFLKARQTSPTIIFFDEIDSIAPRRGLSADSHVTERVVNQLLTEMDGLKEMHDVVVIAATNRPDMIDTGLLRPGRFDRIILAQVPDEKARLEIFKVHTKDMPLKDVNLDDFAKRTEGYAGADIDSVCREAAINALRNDMKAKEVTKKNFEAALAKVRPSVTKDVKEAYENIRQFFSSAKGKEMKDESPNYFG